MPRRTRPVLSASRLGGIFLLHLAVSLAVLAPVSALNGGRERRAPDEEVVVWGERPDEVRSGVVEVLVVDKKGRFLRDLGKGDFVLNGGKVSVDAVTEVRYRPAVLFMIDYTVSLGEGGPAVEDPHLYYAGLMKDLCGRFPDGTSALSFLMAQGVASGTFLGEGEESGWVGNPSLGRLLAEDPGVLFPSRTTPIVPWGDKYLTESLQWVAGRFDQIDSPAYRRFLVFFSDGYEGDPAPDYAAAGGSGVSSEHPCGGFLPWASPEKIQEEVWLGHSLEERRIHPLFLFRPPDMAHTVYLWDRHPFFWCAMNISRTRAGHFVNRSEGTSLNWDVLKPEAAQSAIAAEIDERLSRYWIAWSTPADRKHGETFLKIRVRSRPAGKAVPDRIGEEMLLGGDPYLVRHLGPHELMPWEDYMVLFPQEAGRLAHLAERVDMHRGSAAWQAAAHCPFVLAADAREAALGPLLLSAYRQIYEPPGESMGLLWDETEAFLAGGGAVDLCLYAARLKGVSE